ncbi:MAG: hypothetical protein AABY22_06545, partial [Nanoarchaeota archaeon]
PTIASAGLIWGAISLVNCGNSENKPKQRKTHHEQKDNTEKGITLFDKSYTVTFDEEGIFEKEYSFKTLKDDEATSVSGVIQSSLDFYFLKNDDIKIHAQTLEITRGGNPYVIVPKRKLEQKVFEIEEHQDKDPLTDFPTNYRYSKTKTGKKVTISLIDKIPTIRDSNGKEYFAVENTSKNKNPESPVMFLIPVESAYLHPIRLEGINIEGRRYDVLKGQIVKKQTQEKPTQVPEPNSTHYEPGVDLNRIN